MKVNKTFCILNILLYKLNYPASYGSVLAGALVLTDTIYYLALFKSKPCLVLGVTFGYRLKLVENSPR